MGTDSPQRRNPDVCGEKERMEVSRNWETLVFAERKGSGDPGQALPCAPCDYELSEGGDGSMGLPLWWTSVRNNMRLQW